MRQDLQELEITKRELTRLTGVEPERLTRTINNSKIVMLLSGIVVVPAFLYILLLLFGFRENGSDSLGDFLIFVGIFCLSIFIPSLFDFITASSKQTKFIAKVERYNQIILNINTLDQLEAVGNPIKLNARERVIEALKINRADLIRALETERILKENPKFRPEVFNLDLTELRSLQGSEQATEYGRFFDEALQISIGVQEEMRKIES